MIPASGVGKAVGCSVWIRILNRGGGDAAILPVAQSIQTGIEVVDLALERVYVLIHQPKFPAWRSDICVHHLG